MESTFGHCDWTQGHCGVEPIHILKAERRVEGFGEGASEGVEVDQRIGAHCVEGQRASRPVQIHRHSARSILDLAYSNHSVIVKDKDRVTVPRAAHAPGLVAEADAAVSTFPFPSNSPVSHSHRHPPLCI